MTTPFVLLPSGASNYNFATNQGYGSLVKIPTRARLTGATLKMLVDNSIKFLHPVEAGSVTYVNGEIHINLTEAEVKQLGNKFYRVMVYHQTTSYGLVEGSIDYREIEVDEGGLLDATGKIRIELLPPLTDALDSVFLRREEYVAGVVDPEVLNQAVETKLAAHVNSTSPHPAYDIDAPSFNLIFENGLV